MISAPSGEILGIGVDLVDSRRIKKLLLRHPKRFIHRIFTPQERAYADRQNAPELTYAKRFAAKEAFAKATGLGIGRLLGWQDMEIRSQPNGQPILVISDKSIVFLQKYWQSRFDIMVSLSDECPYAQAFVVVIRARQASMALPHTEWSYKKNMYHRTKYFCKKLYEKWII